MAIGLGMSFDIHMAVKYGLDVAILLNFLHHFKNEEKIEYQGILGFFGFFSETQFKNTLLEAESLGFIDLDDYFNVYFKK